jgi:hypothetical protein
MEEAFLERVTGVGQGGQNPKMLKTSVLASKEQTWACVSSTGHTESCSIRPQLEPFGVFRMPLAIMDAVIASLDQGNGEVRRPGC